ncbi:MAG: aminotransferase class I/II-fold pyridoxal phosphate-dependent enzyme [Pleurocapsa minor GSE-CHR-MK-17-07R]|nr:aminotransferase class I/II-fold pyridoxal phosphate-dependent enzyme [Pleurocapsa minor GSE-CHR-MK 17-07R]
MPALANRLHTLPAYPFAVISQRVAQLNAAGLDVINLDVGSPDMPPPVHAIETLASSAAASGKHGYSGYRGTANFRAAVADYYANRFGITIDPNTQVLPLLGSKEGIVNLSLAYIDDGDVALVPGIGYPAYAMGALMAGGQPHYIPVTEEAGFLPDLDALEARGLPANSKLLWVNYPNNPTGAVASFAFYERAVQFCKRHNLLLASDNPYVDVTYDGYIAHSALEAPDALEHAIEFISFSKTYNMAGWRLGAAVGSAEAISALLQVKSNMDSGHFTPIYDAGISAFKQTDRDWLAERNAVYENRRDLLLEVMPSLGLRPYKPTGALYLWGKVMIPGLDGAQYVELALNEAHVSMAPGAIYGPDGTAYVRMSVCVPDARLDEAVDRLSRWSQRMK